MNKKSQDDRKQVLLPEPIDGTCLARQGERIVYIGKQILTSKATDEAFVDCDRLGIKAVYVYDVLYTNLHGWCVFWHPDFSRD